VQKFASRLVTYDCPVIASAVADPDLELHVREGGRGQFPK